MHSCIVLHPRENLFGFTTRRLIVSRAPIPDAGALTAALRGIVDRDGDGLHDRDREELLEEGVVIPRVTDELLGGGFTSWSRSEDGAVVLHRDSTFAVYLCGSYASDVLDALEVAPAAT